jgi:hypothetical protein
MNGWIFVIHFCTNKNSKKLEKVQERALRFVYEDYNSSYEELLQKAKVPSLQCRCSKSERFFTVPCRFDLWYFQNVAVSERIFRVFHMDKIMKTVASGLLIFLFVYFLFLNYLQNFSLA